MCTSTLQCSTNKKVIMHADLIFCRSSLQTLLPALICSSVVVNSGDDVFIASDTHDHW